MRTTGFLGLIILGSWSIAAQAWMQSVPPKYLDRELKKRAPVVSSFANEQIFNGDPAATKRMEWEACHQKKQQEPTFSLFRDHLVPFVESNKIVRIPHEMEILNLQAGKADRQPWSGDYWPYDGGLIAARNFDPDFAKFWNWKERYDYVNDHPLNQYLNLEKLQQLSPAEKYDLLTGSEVGTLTLSMWHQGKVYFDKYGEVEGWMGLCHGWEPAAIVEPRPEKAIQVSSADGQWRLDLVPAELKGLITYSWATNPYATVTLGNRCDEQTPAEDEDGRLQDPECLDLNPGTWHLAIVNRLGLRKKSFVLDVTYDYQVWNQPVLEYSYQYFHPKTRQEASFWKDAQAKLEDWSEDPYRKHRSAEARSVIGVRMKVAYVVESSVDNQREDNESRDQIRWVVYNYDLELDEKNQVIGGEWYQRSHPDFIWTPKEKARPDSMFDPYLKEPWNVDLSLPATWKKVASVASDQGMILNKVVQGLLGKSKRNP